MQHTVCHIRITASYIAHMVRQEDGEHKLEIDEVAAQCGINTRSAKTQNAWTRSPLNDRDVADVAHARCHYVAFVTANVRRWRRASTLRISADMYLTHTRLYAHWRRRAECARDAGEPKKLPVAINQTINWIPVRSSLVRSATIDFAMRMRRLGCLLVDACKLVSGETITTTVADRVAAVAASTFFLSCANCNS